MLGIFPKVLAKDIYNVLSFLLCLIRELVMNGAGDLFCLPVHVLYEISSPRA